MTKKTEPRYCETCMFHLIKRTEVVKKYGRYRLNVIYDKYRYGDMQRPKYDIQTSITMSDDGTLRYPLLWSTNKLTPAQANAAINLFEAIGYFDLADKNH